MVIPSLNTASACHAGKSVSMNDFVASTAFSTHLPKFLLRKYLNRHQSFLEGRIVDNFVLFPNNSSMIFGYIIDN